MDHFGETSRVGNSEVNNRYVMKTCPLKFYGIQTSLLALCLTTVDQNYSAVHPHTDSAIVKHRWVEVFQK